MFYHIHLYLLYTWFLTTVIDDFKKPVLRPSELVSKRWSIPRNMLLSPIYICLFSLSTWNFPYSQKKQYGSLTSWSYFSGNPTPQDQPPAPSRGPSARHSRPLCLGGRAECLELGQPAVPWQEGSGCRTCGKLWEAHGV